MPRFLVERRYAEQFEMSAEGMAGVVEYEQINDITWLTSFLSADKKKTYCLYEVDDIDILRKHAADLGLPLDAIVEITEIVR
jgi:Protein of unknown function (DUF4242)